MKKLFLIFLIFQFFSFLTLKKEVNALECQPPKKYCSENYTESCTTDDGRAGVKYCFKEGCNDTGGGGPTCPWQGNSHCGPCVPQGTPPPAPTDISECSQISGHEAGRCVRISGQRSCQPSCNNEWSASPSEPNVECVEVKCNPCGNNTSCCRRRRLTDTPPPPPSTETPPQPTRTPTPTNTPTPTRTPTPTIIYVTATPVSTGSPRNQSPIRDNVGYVWVCLKTEAYSGNEYGAGLDHRLKATGQLPHSYGQDIYIVGCVTNNQGIYCTTGNSEKDRYLGISKLDQHTFQILHPQQNPFKIPTNTNQIETYVRSTSRDFMTHTIYAVYRNPSSGVDVGQGGLQQGMPVFSLNAENKCILIKWDPKGKVIDYYTKKPVNNVEIILLNERGQKIIEPGLVNPQKTKEDGIFDFFISEDNRLYKIKVNLPKDYRLIDKKEIINKLPKEFSDPSKYIIYSKNLILKLKDTKNKEVIIFIKSNKENFWRKILNFFIN